MERSLESEQPRTGGRVRRGEGRLGPAAPLPSPPPRPGTAIPAGLPVSEYSPAGPCLACRDLTLQTTDNAYGVSDTYRPTQGSGKASPPSLPFSGVEAGKPWLSARLCEKPRCRRWDQARGGLEGQATACGWQCTDAAADQEKAGLGERPGERRRPRSVRKLSVTGPQATRAGQRAREGQG